MRRFAVLFMTIAVGTPLLSNGLARRDLKIDGRIPRGGAPVTLEFTAPPPERYEMACSEFCGNAHDQMKAALVSIMPTQARY